MDLLCLRACSAWVGQQTQTRVLCSANNLCDVCCQALKQMYVLVLGLDVLGNPFALITGLKEGAKDFFYEPYQVRSALDFSASMSCLFLLSIKQQEDNHATKTSTRTHG